MPRTTTVAEDVPPSPVPQPVEDLNALLDRLEAENPGGRRLEGAGNPFAAPQFVGGLEPEAQPRPVPQAWNDLGLGLAEPAFTPTPEEELDNAFHRILVRAHPYPRGARSAAAIWGEILRSFRATMHELGFGGSVPETIPGVSARGLDAALGGTGGCLSLDIWRRIFGAHGISLGVGPYLPTVYARNVDNNRHANFPAFLPLPVGWVRVEVNLPEEPAVHPTAGEPGTIIRGRPEAAVVDPAFQEWLAVDDPPDEGATTEGPAV